ncbi:MAG: hypothetical protein DRG20_04405 [Deltaproteobacteria bacterium]|nr:DUF3568 family protein [Deltaproteobacteria bacterium]RLA89662.1 MAG: hypothetical protein DRG20_04405 [Deltaproteobacteria bacterium]
MKQIHRIIVILLVISNLIISGCALLVGAGAGAALAVGTYKYIEGALVRDYNRPLNQVYSASLSTLKDMEIKIVSEKKDQLGATIKAQRANNSPVTIKIKRIDRNNSSLSIRVGYIGNKKEAKIIHEEIARRLK